ncbi:PIN domain-containing protein [Nostoc sp.]|uniref:PIN domain-containing protein n=1 Tax=Nostoc sp. TaxID=1180 RepID=UPI002FFC580F
METQALKQPTRLVALDTEIFNKAKFNYQSTSFRQLTKLAKDKKIALYLTTINQQEILSQLEKYSNESVLALKSLHKDFRKKAFIIHNSNRYRHLLNLRLNEQDLYKELIEQYNNFIKEAEVNILSVDTVPVEDIFNKYFNFTPPFKHGEKKYEFPDAFAIAAIEIKAKSEDRIIYVISGDKDWKDAVCLNENLIYQENIDEFLEEIITIEKESEEIDLCNEILEDNLPKIEAIISNNFIIKEFSFSSYFDNGLFEPGSENIDFVEVDAIEVIEKYIVDIDDEDAENPVVTFELIVKVSYAADVSFNSTENAVWVGEDETYYGDLRHIEGKVQQQSILPVEVIIQLSRDKSYNLQFNSLHEAILDPNNTVPTIELKSDNFEVSYEDDDPYLEEYE